MRASATASLATIDAESGAPYASFITVATDSAGAPIFLISKLARHTSNLVSDSRASLLYLGPLLADDPAGDPLTRTRVSVFGRAEISDDAALEQRFLARHETARGYAQFADFAFWRLAAESAHVVAGFGQIYDLGTDDLLTDLAGASALLESEAAIVSHMNEDHADAVALYATQLLGAEPGPWRMTGCDPEGCDLAADSQTLRLTFPAPVATPDEIRQTLVALVKRARAPR
jgi:hypothetical protein